MPSDELKWAMGVMERDRNRAGVSDGYFNAEASRAALPPTELLDPPGTRIANADIAGVPCKWVTPRGGAPSGDCMLYLHGGGFSSGDFGSHRTLVTWLAEKTGSAVLFPEFRLAPEHRFPAGLDDCFATYRHLVERTRSAGGKMSIAGDSAGAGMAVSVLLKARDAAMPLPSAGALICGLFDLDERSSKFLQLTQRTRDMARMYVSYLSDIQNPLVSPILGDLRGLPPLFLQTGSADPCIDESVRLSQRLREHGVVARLEVAPDMFHVWHRFAPRLPEAVEALGRVAEFLRDPRPSEESETAHRL